MATALVAQTNRSILDGGGGDNPSSRSPETLPLRSNSSGLRSVPARSIAQAPVSAQRDAVAVGSSRVQCYYPVALALTTDAAARALWTQGPPTNPTIQLANDTYSGFDAAADAMRAIAAQSSGGFSRRTSPRRAPASSVLLHAHVRLAKGAADDRVEAVVPLSTLLESLAPNGHTKAFLSVMRSAAWTTRALAQRPAARRSVRRAQSDMERMMRRLDRIVSRVSTIDGHHARGSDDHGSDDDDESLVSARDQSSRQDGDDEGLDIVAMPRPSSNILMAPTESIGPAAVAVAPRPEPSPVVDSDTVNAVAPRDTNAAPGRKRARGPTSPRQTAPKRSRRTTATSAVALSDSRASSAQRKSRTRDDGSSRPMDVDAHTNSAALALVSSTTTTTATTTVIDPVSPPSPAGPLSRREVTTSLAVCDIILRPCTEAPGVECSICMRDEGSVLWDVPRSRPATLHDLWVDPDRSLLVADGARLDDDVILLNPCRDLDHAVCVACMRAVLLNRGRPPVDVSRAAAACVSLDGESRCASAAYTEAQPFGAVLDAEEAAYLGALYERHRFPGMQLITCPLHTVVDRPAPPGRRRGARVEVVPCGAQCVVQHQLVTRSQHGHLVVSCTQNTQCGGAFCYHCRSRLPNGATRCGRCTRTAEHDNPEGVNRYFYRPGLMAIEGSMQAETAASAAAGAASGSQPAESHLLRNREITEEVALEQIERVLSMDRVAQPCYRCGVPLLKSTECNALSHCGVQKCYMCGRNALAGGHLEADHWDAHGNVGCPRYDHHAYWRNMKRPFVCAEGRCYNDTTECRVAAHRAGIEAMHTERRVWHVWAMLRSLSTLLRERLIDRLEAATAPTDAARILLLARVSKILLGDRARSSTTTIGSSSTASSTTIASTSTTTFAMSTARS